MAFFGVNFILQKFCSCKKIDKYQVWATYVGYTIYRIPKMLEMQITLTWILCWNGTNVDIKNEMLNISFHQRRWAQEGEGRDFLDDQGTIFSVQCFDIEDDISEGQFESRDIHI